MAVCYPPASPSDNAATHVDAMQPIDYRDLVARHSFAEHAARADRYFATIGLDSVVARKPFASPYEAAELCAGVAALLPDLVLFPGARVLDFGAGTCWMSRLLAMLGCHVTAVDVSRKALEVGEALIRRDALANHLQVEFVVLEGARLPFDDASFDRVVCFDALHHVPDQQGAIREFARVLRPGGIAALHEPGPAHSRTAQSQYEMRVHDVIEADVDVESLVAAGLEAGFTRAEMSLFCPQPVKAGLADFQQFLQDPAGSAVGRRLQADVAAAFENRRVFFLQKGDPFANMDSRSSLGLRAELDLQAELGEDAVVLRGTVGNRGPGVWLPSDAGLGAVKVGIHLFGADGQPLDQDYGRGAVSGDRVGPGECRAVEVRVPYPPGLQQFDLVVDLVAEGVQWFEIAGGRTVRFAVRRDEGRVVRAD